MDVLAYSNIPEHAVEILQGLNQYRKSSPQFCDFILVVDGENLYCHRSVLCLHSEYFRAMIGGMFSEEKENQVAINDADLISLESILDFIYCGRLNIDQKSVENLLKCAIRFQIQKVRRCNEGKYVRNMCTVHVCNYMRDYQVKFKSSKVIDKVLATSCLHTYRRADFVIKTLLASTAAAFPSNVR